jgi:hypothetical protein
LGAIDGAIVADVCTGAGGGTGAGVDVRAGAGVGACALAGTAVAALTVRARSTARRTPVNGEMRGQGLFITGYL